jgi:hypothetical protein
MSFGFGHPCCEKKYPHHSKIQPRCFEELESKAVLRDAFPHNMRRKKLTHETLTKAIDLVEGGLQRDIKEYEDIRKRGNKAMSGYDLRMGYTAQSSGLPLKYAHIGYALGRLRIMKFWHKRLYQGARQQSLFKEAV